MLRTDRLQVPAAGRESRRIRVYDCRFAHINVTPPGVELMVSDELDFNRFLDALRKFFEFQQHERFVLATTDRTALDFDKFRQLPDGSTLYLLQREDQVLPVAMEEHITFRPHYNTLTEGGLYEYYSSEGHNPLSYALAELIDNSLSATAKNTGTRTIEIRLLFDESQGKPAVVILDNGCGMTSKQLRNWAVYRLSKFTRENSTFTSQQEGYVRPDVVPRSLNSDISYFGVGGKQAIFFIGNSTRMITKPMGSPDVHELVLSKDEFERKEKNKQDVYSGVIKNRKPSDSSHVRENDERFLHRLIAEESGKKSFTAVIITGIVAQHVTFLKKDFAKWTRQLAHVYHYYIHGINGNDMRSNTTNSNQSPKIDIQITLRERSNAYPRVMNLREVQDDMQTRYINATAATFEFKATTGVDSGTVEGVIRYHPFLYDRETYPPDPNAEKESPTDEDESGVQNQARGKRPIFECFWNGRLIPYTKVDEFDWCSKDLNVPEECCSRFSGVLFTDDRFQVTTNKLTFMDLEVKVKNKHQTIFTRVDNGQTIRCDIKKEFTKWLQNCHEKLDKQVKFLGYKETITRQEVATKNMQHPWATFSSIELDGKVYTAGQLVKSQRTKPIHHGRVVRFLLYGDHKKDVFATGGEVEVCLEPKALYNTSKTIPIAKIDRTATDEAIKKNIDNDFAKLPDLLQLDWPDGNPWPQNAVRPAGTPLGALSVKILNKKGEAISRMPSAGHSVVTKLSVKQDVLFHGPETNEHVVNFVAPYSAKWGFWFKKNENLTKPGKYTLYLRTIISDTQVPSFGDKPLPSLTLNFTIKEGIAKSFVPGPVSSPLRVGVPFDIPLQFKDKYNNVTVGLPDLQPALSCSDLDLSSEAVESSGTTYTIKGVRARGKVNFHQSKTRDLIVTLPGLEEDTQIVKINLAPGTPHSLYVQTADNPIEVENGNPVAFNVQIHDESGNITAHPRQIVNCQIQIKGLTPVSVDCSTGVGQILTKPINLKIVNGEPQNLKVYFAVPHHKNIAVVERDLRVLPSTKVSTIKVFSRDDENLLLRNNDKIEWLAGSCLSDLFYGLYDEAGRAVPLTAEIASHIMVNWKSEVNVEDLVEGKLPDIIVPMKVDEQRSYQVSYQHQNISIFFTIVPRPDEPDQLKATVAQNTVKLGEILSENINLELADKYGNSTKTLTPKYMNLITVKAEGLDKSSVKRIWQSSNSSVGVTGVRFQSGTLGLRELCFTYLKYEARVSVQVTAGNPAQLNLVSAPEQPLQVINGHGIPKPFVVQLCDEWGNHTSDQSVTVGVQPSPPALKVTTADTAVDTEGEYTFTITSVSGSKGYYQLQFEGSFNNKPIPGPTVNLTVLPDPNKPVSLKVEYNAAAVFRAGGSFPVFLVTVVSDEGIPMTTFNPAAASMLLWEGAPFGNTPPPTTPELKCSKPMGNERQDCFHFRDKEIPVRVGRHTAQFSLRVSETDVLYSDQIALNVVANQPVKLAPESQPAAPVVSCCTDIANRTLVQNMTLRIMDSHGNPAGQDLSGKVVISITSSGNKSVPLFEGTRGRSCSVMLAEGKAHITRLAIMAKSPGEDGCAYTLSFKPEVSAAHLSLTPFELTFHFYDDAVSQLKMTEMIKKKSELADYVAQQKEFFSDHNELLGLLTEQVLTAKRKETDFRDVLTKSNMTVAQPISIQGIDTLLNEKNSEADMILQNPRRVCSIPDNFRGQQDVLGKVGHLAYVQDDAAANVISWFIRGDMDCVITKTSEAAKRIYRDTQGRQQVMPLDTVLVGANRPLPHIRQGGHMLFHPPGNPVHIRDLLIYPHDQESCKIAFKNILGDTILIDDLESANNYRRLVVQNRTPCPTILTRGGDCISAKGKFGGRQNKAPVNVTPVFGAPLPQAYHTVRARIELLNQYRALVEKREKAEKDREDHLKTLKSPEMEQRQKNLKEKTMQLEELERQLGSKPMKRGLEDAGQPSGIITKRAK